MKRNTLLLSLLLLFCLNGISQNLSLNDLTNLCNKKNWEDVNQRLLAKNWTYFDSEKGDSYKYNTITWSFEKDYYSDKAQGWFHLFTYEGFPNKITYAVFNKKAYNRIQNSISSAGFKLVGSEIEDNEVISTYGSSTYTLIVSTEKRNKDDWSKSTVIAYNIALIKKTGIYDPDNGKKVDFYYNDEIKAEYTLLNGKLHGQYKAYYSNGTVKVTGTYKDGMKNGLFKEYDNYGVIEIEYNSKNDELNGFLKRYYENGNIKETENFKKGKAYGHFTKFDEQGILKLDCHVVNGELSGLYKRFYENGELELSGTYLNGEQNGKFVEYDEDGILLAEYVMANGMKNGVLKIFENEKITQYISYVNDIKNGSFVEYKYAEETGELEFKTLGEYLNDEKHNVWSLIYIEDGKERVMTYDTHVSGVKNGRFQDIEETNLIIGNYLDDKLHGEYKEYQDLNRSVFGGVMNTNISELILVVDGMYSHGLKTGGWKYFDFSKTLISQGNYQNDHKTGEWKYYYSNYTDKNQNSLPYARQLYLIENYANGKLHGKKTLFSNLEKVKRPCEKSDQADNECHTLVYEKILETAHYKNGKLSGPFELRDSLNRLVAKGDFQYDKKNGEWFTRFSETDSDGSTYFVYQEGNFRDNIQHGKWIQYLDKDNIDVSYNYNNGRLDGEYVVFNQNSKPAQIKQFKAGELLSLAVYNEEGNDIVVLYEIYNDNFISYNCRRIEYADLVTISQEYFVKKDGEIKSETFESQFLKAINNESTNDSYGYKDGFFKIWDASDKLLVSGKYFKENQIDLWAFYYHDQGVKIESYFVNNKKMNEKYLTFNGELFSGEFIFNNTDDNIKEIRKIKDGLRHGKTIYIDLATGKKIKKEKYKEGQLN